jgi:hypothetical protein
MRTLSAHIENNQIVLEEAVNLPNGLKVQVIFPAEPPLKPNLSKIQSSDERLNKIKDFIEFVEYEGILVEKLNIPERDARNVR